MSLPNATIKQLKSIENDFARIERNANKKVLKPAMKEAVKPVVKQAKANAPWASIRRLIKGMAFISKKNEVFGKIFIGQAKDRTIKLEGRDVPFEVVANILEFGRAGAGKAGGVKVVQPKAFMRNAPAQVEGEVMRILQREIIKKLRRV